MEQRMDDMMIEETTATRRVVAKGVAAGGLVALFAAVGAGRVLAQGEDTTGDGADSADTGLDDGLVGDTSGDEGGLGGDTGDEGGLDGDTSDDGALIGGSQKGR